jgi:hypothetical protein
MSVSKVAGFGLGVAISALAASAASAGVYDFSVTDDNGLVASGQFDTTAAGEVDSLTGTVVGSFFAPDTGPMTLVPNPTFPTPTDNGSFIYDNLYDGSVGSDLSGGFNDNGLLFTVGGIEFNLYNPGYNTSPGYILYEAGGTNESVTFNASVPEPASWALVLVGFGGLGAVLRGSRKKAVAAAV